MITIAAVIATIGRKTLEQTLDSIAAQALPGDQVVLVQDSRICTDDLSYRIAPYGSLVTFLSHDGGYSFKGIPQSNLGFSLVTADVVLSCGDDDAYELHAFARIRDVMTADPLRPMLFRVRMPKETLWTRARFERSRLTGQSLATPRRWCVEFSPDQYVESDFDWICDCCTQTGRRYGYWGKKFIRRRAIAEKAAALGLPWREPFWCDDVLLRARIKAAA